MSTNHEHAQWTVNLVWEACTQCDWMRHARGLCAKRVHVQMLELWLEPLHRAGSAPFGQNSGPE